MLPKYPRRTDLRSAVARLRRGDIIAYPTEGVWGLGCDPQNRRAFRKILVTKRRARAKGVLLVAASASQGQRYWLSGDPLVLDPAQFWPGTTLVLPVSRLCPAWIRGKQSGVAIRVSDHPAIRTICRQFGGAIVSTSANPAGLRPPRTLRTLRRYFPSRSVWVLPARPGKKRHPSRILDARNGKILRS